MGSSVFFLCCGGNAFGSGMFHLTQIFHVSVLRDSLVFLCSVIRDSNKGRKGRLSLRLVFLVLGLQ